MGNGVLIQRVFQLGGIVVRKVDPVVVLLTEEIQPRQRFQGAELLPQGELVGGVVLIAGHEFAGENGADGQLRAAAPADGAR